MRGTYLYLHKFNPLSFLSDITTLDYTIVEPIQLILGSNGSGKSSLLGVASPAMPDPASFSEGGIWRYHFEDKGHLYELGAEIGKRKTEWSFVMDGVELNEGGTSTVQKQLVEHYTSYTTKLHNILTGNVSFCAMSAATREEFLMDLANLDFKYARTMYQQSKDYLNIARGAVKVLSGKLEETVLALSQTDEGEDYTALANKAELALLEILPYTNRSLVTVDYDKLLSDLEQSMGETVSLINKRANELDTLYLTTEPYTQEDLIRIDHAAELAKEKTKERVNQFSVLHETMEKLNHAKEIDTGYLETLKAELASLGNFDDIPANVKCISVSEASDAINRLTDIHSSIESFPFTPLTQHEISLKFTEPLRELDLRIVAEEYTVRECTTRLSTLIRIQDEKVSCTACGNTFHPKGEHCTTDTINSIQGRLEEAKGNIQVLSRQRELLNYDYAEEAKKREVVESMRALSKACPTVRELLLSFGGITECINCIPTIQSELSKVFYYQTDLETANALKARIAPMEDALGIMRSMDGDDTFTAYNRIQKELDDLNTECDRLSAVRKTASQVCAYRSKLEELCYKLDREFTEYNDLLAKSMAYEETSEVNAEASSLQAMVGALREKARKRDNLELRLKETEDDLAEWNVKLERRKTLVDMISPKHGIIGEQLRKVATCFLEDLNKVISKIWTYDLAVTMPESSYVDFRFTATVNGKPIPSIQKLSQGQKDIVDFAVSLMIMEYRGLTDYPLYLDEIGSSFDYEHRRHLIEFIRSLANTNVCSQIFLIQHYAEDYGGIAGADVIVLNPDNIATPADISTNYEIS